MTARFVTSAPTERAFRTRPQWQTAGRREQCPRSHPSERQPRHHGEAPGVVLDAVRDLCGVYGLRVELVGDPVMGASQANGLGSAKAPEPSGLDPTGAIPSALKPGDYRYTVQTIASGQPRAYADTIRHVRVSFEWVPYRKREEGEQPAFEPCVGWSEEAAARSLKGLSCGFTDFVPPPNPSMDDHFRTRLDWLREVSPGVWEFHTTAAYDD